MTRENLLKPAIRRSDAYPIAHADGMIKLDAMENPYTWPSELHRQWAETLATVAVNRYPSPTVGMQMEQTLRRWMVIPDSVATLFGNGSDEIIQIILLALRLETGLVLVPGPSFTMYRVIAQHIGLPFREIPLTTAFELDRPAMLDAIQAYRPAVIFLACPNNPTGNLFDPDTVEELIRLAPGLVVLDEAYSVFSGQTKLDCLQRYEHLLIIRTLSKLGLAGLRLGVLLGAPRWLAQFEKIKLPYNISSLNQQAVIFFGQHIALIEKQIERIISQREHLYSALLAVDGLTVWPSKTNFLLLRSEKRSSDEVAQGLRQAGILIKNLAGAHPQLDNCLRVTIGTEAENAYFLEKIQEILRA